MYYRYLFNEKALVGCPSCGRDLTRMGGIELWLSMAGVFFVVPSRLNGNGELMDTEDCAIAAGFHSSTCCGGCGEQLIDLDNVQEIVMW